MCAPGSKEWTRRRKWVLLCVTTAMILWQYITPVDWIYIPAMDDSDALTNLDNYYTSLFGAHSYTYYGLEVVLKERPLSHIIHSASNNAPNLAMFAEALVSDETAAHWRNLAGNMPSRLLVSYDNISELQPRTLHELGVRAGDTIWLGGRLRGGMQRPKRPASALRGRGKHQQTADPPTVDIEMDNMGEAARASALLAGKDSFNAALAAGEARDEVQREREADLPDSEISIGGEVFDDDELPRSGDLSLDGELLGGGALLLDTQLPRTPCTRSHGR